VRGDGPAGTAWHIPWLGRRARPVADVRASSDAGHLPAVLSAPGRSGPVIRSPSLTTAHMGSPSPRSSGRSPLRRICGRRSLPPKGFRRGPKKWPRAGRAFALGWAEPAATGRQGVEECAGVAVPMAARGQIGWAQALEVDALGRGVVVDAGSALEGRRGFTGRRPSSLSEGFRQFLPDWEHWVVIQQ
jgi:hypothetical protein